MRKFFTSLFLAALIGASAYACPANRGLIQVPQPDGTLVTIQLNGDEFYSFNTTSDGYTIKLNHAGAYVYAQLNEDGQLVETPILAHDADQRSVVELSLLANTPKRLVDQEEVEMANMRRVKRNVDLSNFDFDNFRGLVILIDFADKTFASDDPQAFYTEMFSTENLTGFHDPVTGRDVTCLGSVRDYFSDQSNGAFKPPFDVYGPYTSSRKASQCDQYSTSIFTTALKKANDDVDFKRYDNNNDGRVDMIYFLVAGYSASTNGEQTGYLWPHASNLASSYISYDGKWMDRYASSTELYGWESIPSTVTVEGIGTVCHEFSHVLGLPDFYDTDYGKSGGESHHPGEWDVMAGGGDFNNGRTPAGYTLFERYALGWANPKTITKAGTYSMEAVNVSRTGFILRTPVENEFFTIENRQKTSWDSYIPGHGMIVTRVDSTNVSVWSSNKINCNPSHNYFEMLRAGNTTEGDLSSDPFPGSMGNPIITNETAPNLRTWGNYANRFNITGVSEKNGIITFNVVEDGSIQTLVEDFEGMTANSSTTDTGVEGEFTTWSFNKCGVRAPGSGKANGTNSVMMKLPSQLYSTEPIYYNIYMASLTVFNTGSYLSKYSLEYSTDGGENWIKVNCANGKDGIEIPSKTTFTGYWNLNLNNHTPAVFRISQVGGNKNASTYVDDFTLYYTGEEGGPLPYLVGDVNGDGEITIADINAVIDIILGGSADAGTLERADVNADGEIGIADANSVLDIMLK